MLPIHDTTDTCSGSFHDSPSREALMSSKLSLKLSVLPSPSLADQAPRHPGPRLSNVKHWLEANDISRFGNLQPLMAFYCWSFDLESLAVVSMKSAIPVDWIRVGDFVLEIFLLHLWILIHGNGSSSGKQICSSCWHRSVRVASQYTSNRCINCEMNYSSGKCVHIATSYPKYGHTAYSHVLSCQPNPFVASSGLCPRVFEVKRKTAMTNVRWRFRLKVSTLHRKCTKTAHRKITSPSVPGEQSRPTSVDPVDGQHNRKFVSIPPWGKDSQITGHKRAGHFWPATSRIQKRSQFPQRAGHIWIPYLAA